MADKHVVTHESQRTEPCVVCGMTDARGLVSIELGGGAVASLCGTHELMYLRSSAPAATVDDLRASFSNRRNMDRRARGEVDELAANLASAFTAERRVTDRRS